MSSRFVPNAAFLGHLSRTAEMRHVIGRLTEQTADAARANAPEFAGNYREGIETEVGVEDGDPTGRVIANDMASGFIEFGTQNNPAFAPLRRAAESVVGPVMGDRE